MYFIKKREERRERARERERARASEREREGEKGKKERQWSYQERISELNWLLNSIGQYRDHSRTKHPSCSVFLSLFMGIKISILSTSQRDV